MERKSERTASKLKPKFPRLQYVRLKRKAAAQCAIERRRTR
jgi:hypothetical protein